MNSLGIDFVWCLILVGAIGFLILVPLLFILTSMIKPRITIANVLVFSLLTSYISILSILIAILVNRIVNKGHVLPTNIAVILYSIISVQPWALLVYVFFWIRRVLKGVE